MHMPYVKFEPLTTRLPFVIEVRSGKRWSPTNSPDRTQTTKLKIDLSLPTSNTIGSFVSPKNREIAVMDGFRLDGIYEYCSVLEGFVPEDTMMIDVKVSTVVWIRVPDQTLARFHT